MPKGNCALGASAASLSSQLNTAAVAATSFCPSCARWKKQKKPGASLTKSRGRDLKMTTKKTAGELREFLMESIQKVSEGKLTVERASVVIKGAAQINEGLYAELKAKALSKQLGETVYKTGETPLF
jgi:hypothetical protein